MKKMPVFLFGAAVLLLAPVVLSTQSSPGMPTVASSGCLLRIHVDGFRNAKGNLGTVLFKTSSGWPEDLNKTFRHGPAPIDQASRIAVANWTDIPPGDYAVAAIHDENSNHHLDRNFFGIPKEGFGFANNPRVTIAAPSFKQAIVHVGCPVTDVTIHLQYK